MRAGELKPGTVLMEGEIAARYRVSRTPVREALRRLSQDGLIEQRGARLVVSQPTRQQVEEIYPIVSLLEGLAARLAAGASSRRLVTELRRLNAEMEKALVEDHHAGYVEANQRFHELIVEESRNSMLSKEIMRFRTILTHLRSALLELPGRKEQSLAQHARVIEALEAGDADAAESVMREHVDTAQVFLTSAVAAAELLADEERDHGRRRTAASRGRAARSRQARGKRPR